MTKRITKNLSEPWFTLVLLGLKTVEGRLDKGEFDKGDIVCFENNDIPTHPRKVTVKIKEVVKYNNFQEYLTNEGIHSCLPGITDIDTGIAIYNKYFTIEQQSIYDVIAIRFDLA